ncbi:hypothetical protein VJ923_07225 [Adlercreutzia sp. R25]|uniref:hypothetical protein n=1 Tax=Adlercreutzia shanghongiae TaxID=3111773 RepID=UPI002DBA5077|nr:hypothetical protein [Adlercreutzia sp. R25]MEC4272945.1 hypothetical protein [Adlercreutzia sp. R25]
MDSLQWAICAAVARRNGDEKGARAAEAAKERGLSREAREARDWRRKIEGR